MMWDKIDGVMTEKKREQCRKDLSKRGGIVLKIYQKLKMSKGRGHREISQKISEGGGWDEEPERSCRCSRRPTAAETQLPLLSVQHQPIQIRANQTANHPPSFCQHVCWDAASHTFSPVLLIFHPDNRAHQIIKTGWIGCTQDFGYRSGRIYVWSQRGPHTAQNPYSAATEKVIELCLFFFLSPLVSNLHSHLSQKLKLVEKCLAHRHIWVCENVNGTVFCTDRHKPEHCALMEVLQEFCTIIHL